ncbi:MAG: permease-like cell division protein FtsX [Gammaproteobacteria bacterium]|nr:permease-like cell division protein FtsX [Gammaproteobacteria bacterium]MBU1972388.1 permease-like cell division protein FtsX [Gammaproteobacteria bacterium]
MIVWLRQHRNALALALRRLAGAPVNTLLSLLAIGVALALPAGGQMLYSNARSALPGLSASPQISLFMAVDAKSKDTQDIAERLHRFDGIASAKPVSREVTLARMKAGAGLAEVLEALPQNPFPDAFVVNPRDERPEAMEKLAAELRKLPRVEHVQLDSAWVQRLDALLRLGRTAVLLLALLLGVGLVAITFNSIRLQVLTSRAEIEVSRLLGATDAFIRRPYYWFGALQGLLGGLVAWAMVFGATVWLRGPIFDLASLYRLDFALAPLAASDAGLMLVLAAALGWTGAALSLHETTADN